MTFSSLARKPSAFLPVGISAAALGVLLVHVLLVGTEPQPDEGLAAHLWQLLMAGQLPIIAVFALRWLPEEPGNALRMLMLQIGAFLLALAPVWLLGF